MPTVIDVANRQRAALLKADIAAQGDLIRAYADLARRLRGEMEALVEAIAGMDELTPSAVYRLRAYKNLMESLAAETARFGGYLETSISARAMEALQRGSKDAQEIIKVALSGNRALIADLQLVPQAALEALVAFLSKDSELYKRIQGMAGANTEAMKEAIIRGVAVGDNPKTTARALMPYMDTALGATLTDAMRTMRTAQLWAYRSASQASNIANSNVVRGWQWMAREDSDVCPACLAMHGTVHEPDEILDGHYNCRCVMLPLTVLDRENPIPDGRGEDYFKSLSEDQQRAMLGPGKYEAYQEGRFAFGDLATHKDNEVYGHMTVERTLSELLGE